MLPILTNFSPFPADVTQVLDPHARQHHLIVVSAAFEALPGQATRIAEDQPKLAEVDVYHGPPGASSVRYDADFAPGKPKVDVVINGSAYAPRGQTTTRVGVGIRIEGLLVKTLVVSGDRFWKRSVLGFAPSSPDPFTKMPIVYERAYGGTKGDSTEPRNPIGVGHAGASSVDPEVRSEVPNVEHPGAQVTSRGDKPEPAGFGVIARGWAPRLGLAGTYDEKWKQEQFPLLPLDFDSHFFQAAPGDQQVAEIRGGETGRVSNMTPDGEWSFVVPRLMVPLQLRYSDHIEGENFRVDTLVIEPDLYRITLKARVAVSVRRNAPPLQEVVVGHGSRAWWRARLSGKRYLGPPDHGARAGAYFSG